MLTPVLTLNDETGKRELYVVPSSELEEKFVVWFSHQHGVPQVRHRGRFALQLPEWNDPDHVMNNVNAAYEQFVKRFHYTEIPNLIGLPLERAIEQLAECGLHWSIVREENHPGVPPGTVLRHNPRPQSTAVMDSVVYLDITRRPG
ncbi:MAG: PASTA domain-containing protein [Candidatus Xenobia bacterium]